MVRDNKVKINVKDRLEDNVLDLSLSEIETIPVKEIAALRRATVVDLSSNKIVFIGKNFGTLLSRLTRLDLSRNDIKFLPEDFGNLVNLKHLDLYSNKLEHLPFTFGGLVKLRYLDLKSNPLDPALQKIIGPCISSKDCADAARRIVPYMATVEIKIRADMKRKQEEEAKRLEDEAMAKREEERLAKKAARKERVLKERKEKADEEKLSAIHIMNEPLAKDVKKENSMKESKSRKRPASSSRSFYLLLRTLIPVFIIFFSMIMLIIKYSPIDKLINYLPKDQQTKMTEFYLHLQRCVNHIIDGILNLYKW
ncbi:unnamed protein product [Diamesa serratosioi]